LSAPPAGRRRGPAAADLVELALVRHRDGQLDDAAQLYDEALRIAPDHAGALHRLGLIRAGQGRLDDALKLLRRAVRRTPDAADARNDLGAVLKLLGRPKAAIVAFEAAIAVAPGFAKAHYNLGGTLRGLGRIEPAIAAFRAALAADPDLVQAHHDLGAALTGAGRVDEALPHLERAAALEPANATARFNLARLLQALDRRAAALDAFEAVRALDPTLPELDARIGALALQLGRIETACAALGRAIERTPDVAELHCNLAAALGVLGRHEEAVGCFERALALKPDFAPAHNDLGNALQNLARFDDAVSHYREALQLQPGYVDAYNNLGIALSALGRHEDAIASYRAALALAPTAPDTHVNMGTALNGLGREVEALAWFDQALALDPANANAYANRGLSLKVLGQLDAARAVLERAVALAPRSPRHYLALADCRRFAPGDPLVAAMEALAREQATLPVGERICLGFALAKALADMGEPARGFEHLSAANGLKRRQIAYDEAGTLAGFARLADVFTPETMRARAGAGARGATPVFIVGMPRSGTTLVEQILANHPSVHGAGELETLPRAVAALNTHAREQAAGAYPALLRDVAPQSLVDLGMRYLAETVALAPDAARITDKLPLNFVHVGLIHWALPDARVIAVERDPVDTCLSCYSKLFVGNHPYAYDLGELGRYHRGYQDVMALWRSVLPDGVLLTVRYEDVVADLEGAARRIVAHCGLDWHPGCLAFHEATRAVRTASLVQVRQPLYREALGRAAPYRHLLGPLLDGLGLA